MVEGIMNVVIGIAKEYLVLILAVLGVLIYFGYKKIKSIKNKKKKNKQEDEPFASLKVKPEPKLKEADVFSDTFGYEDQQEEEKSKDVVERIRNINNNLKKNSGELDENMVNEFQEMRRQLKEVHDRREQIRYYGLELGKLFQKYRQREYYLTSMMSGMERIIKLKKVPQLPENKIPKKYQPEEKMV